MGISLRSVLKPYYKVGLLLVLALASSVFGFHLSGVFFSGNAPTQPIAFSHKLHAGEHEIPCLHCHIYADRSPSAGVPPMTKCMGCHQNIAKDRPEIVLLTDYWQKQEPIPWIKVHDLPDFVHFSHKRHVKAGLGCVNCHGAVDKMDVVQRVNTLEMGWCVNCHKDNAVRFGTDCATCHK